MSEPKTCPVCNGAKTVSRPPHITGDQPTWVSSGLSAYACVACNATGIVWTAEDRPAEPAPRHRVSPDSLGKQGIDEVAGVGPYHIELLGDNAAHLELGPDIFTVFYDKKAKCLVVRLEPQ